MVRPVRMLEGGGAPAPMLGSCYARRAGVANPALLARRPLRRAHAHAPGDTVPMQDERHRRLPEPRAPSPRLRQPAMPLILHWDGISWRVGVGSAQRSASE